MAVVRRAVRGVAHVGKHKPHRMSAARIAQLQRWQMLGAQARRGQATTARTAHHVGRARKKRAVLGGYAKAVKWGVSKTLLPSSLVTPLVPGYQPGDRTYMSPKRR